MSRIIFYLIVFSFVSSIHAIDQWIYGAWWTTVTPKGNAKQAGELKMVLRDFPNSAGLGYIESEHKFMFSGGTPTLSRQIGGWRISGKSILIEINDPSGNTFSFKGKINGTTNIIPSTLSGTWTWPATNRKGKFQGGAAMGPLWIDN